MDESYQRRYAGSMKVVDRLVFSLFVGTTLAIFSLPEVARILMELALLKSGTTA